MAGRSRSSFNKRQKERSRQEKQREKLERRVQRKTEKQSDGSSDESSFVIEDMSAFNDQMALPNSGLDE
jgi:hypothetical protein